MNKPRQHLEDIPALITYLRQNPAAPMEQVLAHFNCSLAQLRATLETPEFLTRFKLQHQLSYIQSRLAASDSLPQALAKTITLMHESEKPEVARRAAAALIQIAGLTIRTASQPAPQPVPEPPAPEKPALSAEELNLGIQLLLLDSDLKDDHKIEDADAIKAANPQAYVETLRNFCIKYQHSREPVATP